MVVGCWRLILYLYHGASFSTDDGFGTGTPSWYIDPSVTKVDITTTSQSPVLMASGPLLWLWCRCQRFPQIVQDFQILCLHRGIWFLTFSSISKYHLPVKCDSVKSLIYHSSSQCHTQHESNSWPDGSVLDPVTAPRICPVFRIRCWLLLFLKGCVHRFRTGWDSGKLETKEVQIQWAE